MRLKTFHWKSEEWNGNGMLRNAMIGCTSCQPLALLVLLAQTPLGYARPASVWVGMVSLPLSLRRRCYWWFFYRHFHGNCPVYSLNSRSVGEWNRTRKTRTLNTVRRPISAALLYAALFSLLLYLKQAKKWKQWLQEAGRVWTSRLCSSSGVIISQTATVTETSSLRLVDAD